MKVSIKRTTADRMSDMYTLTYLELRHPNAHQPFTVKHWESFSDIRLGRGESVTIEVRLKTTA